MPPRPPSPAVLIAFFAFCTVAAAQTPISLTAWTVEAFPTAVSHPAGSWVVAPDGLSVDQTVNSAPTVLVGSVLAFGGVLTGTLTCNTTADDDLVGFVLGFQAGDATNPAADYLVVDWKKQSQSFDFSGNCTTTTPCPAGLAVSRVTGIPTLDELWGHVDVAAVCSPLGQGVTELARATTLGSTGWVTGQTYAFAFALSATGLDVWVDGVLELSVTGTFQNGPIGFYNFSQQDVTYAAFSLDCAHAAQASGYGSPSPGSAGPAILAVFQLPALGTTVTMAATNTTTAPKSGFLLTAPTPASLTVVGLSFPILVDVASPGFVLHEVPMLAAGWLANVPIPDEPLLCGFELRLQMLQWDAVFGAWAGSNGLTLVFGEAP